MHSNIYDLDFPAINLSKSECRTINNHSQLFDELELLRSENYQLRLRVYNAEQRIDRLLAAAAFGRDRKTSYGTETGNKSTDTDSDCTDTDSTSTDTDSASTDTDSTSSDTDSVDANANSGHTKSGTGQNNAAVKATAEVAVRAIHDLNRRLMAFMAAPVSAKSVTPLKTIIDEDVGVGSEVTSLRGQCSPSRSVQQLMKTELWARNRKFDKLKQKQCMAQVANDGTGRAGSGISQNNASEKSTAVAIQRTIHDLLNLNRRLLALMVATVSGKSVSISAENKQCWRELRSHIEKYAVDGTNKEKTDEVENHDDVNDDEFYDAPAMDSETFFKARILSAECSVTRQNVLRSPPRPQMSTPLQTVSEEDEGVGSDVTRLQGQCRPIRSVQQMMKTELWAQNQKYFGKLEQKRFMAQVAYGGAPRDRRLPEQVSATAIAVPPRRHRQQEFHLNAATSTASLPTTKGILMIQSAVITPCTAKAPEAACIGSQTAAAPPPVLSDYSEADFFFSCDEEDEDDDVYGRRKDFAEVNCTSPSEKRTADWNDCRNDEESVRLAAIGAPMRTRRHCRPRHRQPRRPIKGGGELATVQMITSTSTKSATAKNEANVSNGDGVITTKMIATSSCAARRYGNVGRCLIKWRRGMTLRRWCFGGRVDAAAKPANRRRPPSVADAQVQCGDENVAVVDHVCNCSDRGEGELQLLQSCPELNAQWRKNGRLNDILPNLQREMRPGDRETGDSGPRVPLPDSNPSGSPEPSQRATGAVDGRIAKLLPPLLSVQPIPEDAVDGGDGDHQRDRQEQQMQLQLTHLRERIGVYRRQELDGVGDDRGAVVLHRSVQQGPEDPLNDVIRRMDHTNLINVGLPLVVGRLRRALVLLQNRPENVARK